MRDRTYLLSALICMISQVGLQADIHLPPILSDHMVLVRSNSAAVWGKADPRESVTVEFNGKAWSTTAGPDGRWRVQLDLSNSTAGPFQLFVKGRNQVVVSDVLVGRVWVASGQSNMELPLQATLGAEQEIARSSDPLLRVFKVAKIGRRQPVEDCDGHWVIAGPETSGAFSAVAYYFAKRLKHDLHLPVGIIDASWSGTYSELWMSEDAIRGVEVLRQGDDLRRKIFAEYAVAKQRFTTDFGAWLAANGREDRLCPDPASFSAEDNSAEGWSAMNLPGELFDRPFTGAAWIRKKLDITEAAINTGRDFKVLLGDIEGFEQVFWNGAKVSETSYKTYPGLGYPRYFPIPAKLLHAGENTIAVRIFAPAVSPRVTIASDRFKAGAVSLVGKWLVKIEYQFSRLPAAATETLAKPPKQPPMGTSSSIFNGVVNPITSYGVDGVVWYQGEGDAQRGYEYRIALRAMITDWRSKWKQSHLPFYICQLHSYGPKKSAPGESEYAEVRESQAAVLDLPETGMTVLFDIGESNDEHPRNKKEAGDRLAAVILAKQYGENIPYSGPEFESAKIEDGRILVRFHHAEVGLAARPLPAVYDVSTLIGETAPLDRTSPASALQGFSICGEDRHWVWADARIDGDSVVVWSSQVPHPVAVRYGWADNPTVNLVNGSGLPAGPFRTDIFPAYTANNHYGPTP
jgi:sialate O-acetylesterase